MLHILMVSSQHLHRNESQRDSRQTTACEWVAAGWIETRIAVYIRVGSWRSSKVALILHKSTVGSEMRFGVIDENAAIP
jgi:hypothetical protein